MRKIQFIEDYATRLKGDVWEGCEGQLASELVRLGVAVYIDEGERSAFKLNPPDGQSPDFVVTQEHLDNQPSLAEQGVKLGDKVIITATVIPSVPQPEIEAISDIENDLDANQTKVDDVEDTEDGAAPAAPATTPPAAPAKDANTTAAPKASASKPAAPKGSASKPAAAKPGPKKKEGK